VASVGGITTPADLSKVSVLHQHDRSEWNAWLAQVGADAVKFPDETIIEDSNIAMQAAIAGQGVALGSFPFVQEEVDAGRLIKPFEDELTPTRRYYILTRPGALRQPEVKAVCDWLQAEAAEYARLWPYTKAGSATDDSEPSESMLTP